MNREIGARIREARGSMSQAVLAEKMQARGADWTQKTVTTVETGTRPARFAEAVLVADVLGVSLDALAGRASAGEAEALRRAQVAEDRLRRARKALDDVIEADPFAPRWER